MHMETKTANGGTNIDDPTDLRNLNMASEYELPIVNNLKPLQQVKNYFCRKWDYWKTNLLFGSCFSIHIRPDPFLLIPSENMSNSTNRLFKILPIIRYFNKKINAVFYLNKKLRID